MTTTTPAVETTAGVRSLVITRFAELERAWNRADAQAFGEAFATDTDFVDIRGGHHAGRSAVAEGHRALFEHIYAGSVIGYQVEDAHEVAPGCVIAIASATLRVPGGPWPGTHRSRMTAVLAEHGGRWRIRAFQNTLLQERG